LLYTLSLHDALPISKYCSENEDDATHSWGATLNVVATRTVISNYLTVTFAS